MQNIDAPIQAQDAVEGTCGKGYLLLKICFYGCAHILLNFIIGTSIAGTLHVQITVTIIQLK